MISIILPIYNGETTLLKTLGSLKCQSAAFDELIIIDDNSSDSSFFLVNKFLFIKGIKKIIIKHQRQRGLASVYNEGIRTAKGDLIVTLHQDVILQKDSLEKLTLPFEDDNVVAASHIVMHPLKIWNTYNFWQKCYFARLAGKDFSGIDGKFDCFRKKALERAGLFDELNFKSAGEDGDMLFKLKKIGKIVDTKAKIIHLHKISNNFSPRDICYKQKQYSEAQGVLFILGRIKSLKSIIRVFFREILIITLFIPYIQVLSLVIIIFYSFTYSKIMFINEYKDKRILLVPFLNIYLLFVSFIYSFKGIIFGKQNI